MFIIILRLNTGAKWKLKNNAYLAKGIGYWLEKGDFRN